MKFEREVIQEIWRTSQCTFTVVYPTSSMVCVKGLRGVFGREEFYSILGILYREGFKKVIFERDIAGVLTIKEYPLKEKYGGKEGTTFKRDNHGNG